MAKSAVALLVIMAVFQACRGHAKDSDDPGTSAGNDTITTTDRYGKDRYDSSTQEPGSGNTAEGHDSTRDSTIPAADSSRKP